MSRSLSLLLLAVLFSPLSHAAYDSDFYHQRYGRTDVYSKLVDNHGDGYENLYGLRNVREVLKGVLYRGGGNNLYHRDPNMKRENQNPLPLDGEMNLCEEGFRTGIYLYPTNYSKNPPTMDCNSIRGNNRLSYEQLGFMSKTRTILEKIHAAILDPAMGPIYVHCWNGWHASGYIGAFALKQFCGVSGSDAVKYWIKNADGTDDGSYEEHKKRIRDFVPYTDLNIDSSAQARVCPGL